MKSAAVAVSREMESSSRLVQVQTQFPRGSSLTFNRRLMSANRESDSHEILGRGKRGGRDLLAQVDSGAQRKFGLKSIYM